MNHQRSIIFPYKIGVELLPRSKPRYFVNDQYYCNSHLEGYLLSVFRYALDEHLLHNGCMGETSTGRGTKPAAIGTHKLKRILLYFEEVLDNFFGDRRIYLVMFRFYHLPHSENSIPSTELVAIIE